MSEYSRHVPSERQSDSAASDAADLNTQLNQAYLAGDGAAVERIMARLAADQMNSGLTG